MACRAAGKWPMNCAYDRVSHRLADRVRDGCRAGHPVRHGNDVGGDAATALGPFVQWPLRPSRNASASAPPSETPSWNPVCSCLAHRPDCAHEPRRPPAGCGLRATSAPAGVEHGSGSPKRYRGPEPSRSPARAIQHGLNVADRRNRRRLVHGRDDAEAIARDWSHDHQASRRVKQGDLVARQEAGSMCTSARTNAFVVASAIERDASLAREPHLCYAVTARRAFTSRGRRDRAVRRPQRWRTHRCCRAAGATNSHGRLYTLATCFQSGQEHRLRVATAAASECVRISKWVIAGNWRYSSMADRGHGTLVRSGLRCRAPAAPGHNAKGLEHFQRAGVDDTGARSVGTGRLAVDDQAWNVQLGQGVGEGQAGRPGADDQNVGGRGRMIWLLIGDVAANSWLHPIVPSTVIGVGPAHLSQNGPVATFEILNLRMAVPRTARISNLPVRGCARFALRTSRAFGISYTGHAPRVSSYVRCGCGSGPLASVRSLDGRRGSVHGRFFNSREQQDGRESDSTATQSPLRRLGCKRLRHRTRRSP